MFEKTRSFLQTTLPRQWERIVYKLRTHRHKRRLLLSVCAMYVVIATLVGYAIISAPGDNSSAFFPAELVAALRLSPEQEFVSGGHAEFILTLQNSSPNEAIQDINFNLLSTRETVVDDTHQELVRRLYEQYAGKLVLPQDFLFDAAGIALDIGPVTVAAFTAVIDESKTVFWNGPMGRYEEAEFAEGTKQIAAHLAKLKGAYTVVGGGDTIANLTPARAAKISFLSMGGGATLDYLAKL